jgi:hypothetical protein
MATAGKSNEILATLHASPMYTDTFSSCKSDNNKVISKICMILATVLKYTKNKRKQALFVFPAFWLLAYLMKVIPDSRLAHFERHLMKVIPDSRLAHF